MLRRVVGFVLTTGVLVGFCAAGGAAAPVNLTGTWHGTDGSTYLIKQAGTAVTWYAHSADDVTWAHDFTGHVKGDLIVGSWKDRATHQIRQTGQLTLRIVDENHLVFVSSTAGFGTQQWERKHTAGRTFANNCTARIGPDDKEYRTFLGLDDQVKPNFLMWLKPMMNDYIARVPAYPGINSKGRIPGESVIGLGQHSDNLASSTSDIRVLFGHSDAPQELIKDGNVFARMTPQYEAQLETKIKASAGNLSPTDITLLALQVTGGSYPLAVLTVHNLLKNQTVKAREAISLAGQAFNTKLYARRCGEALVALKDADQVVSKLESLRQNPRTAADKMGSWYHSFAVLAIGALTNHDGAFVAQQAEQTTKLWGGFAGEATYNHEKNQLDLCWAQVTGIKEVDALARSWLPSSSAINSMAPCWAAFS